MLRLDSSLFKLSVEADPVRQKVLVRWDSCLKAGQVTAQFRLAECSDLIITYKTTSLYHGWEKSTPEHREGTRQFLSGTLFPRDWEFLDAYYQLNPREGLPRYASFLTLCDQHCESFLAYRCALMCRQQLIIKARDAKRAKLQASLAIFEAGTRPTALDVVEAITVVAREYLTRLAADSFLCLLTGVAFRSLDVAQLRPSRTSKGEVTYPLPSLRVAFKSEAEKLHRMQHYWRTNHMPYRARYVPDKPLRGYTDPNENYLWGASYQGLISCVATGV